MTNIFKRPHHFFFDAEALGPPAYGSVFAVGLVRFAMPFFYRDGSPGWTPGADPVVQKWQWNVIVDDPFGRGGSRGSCEPNALAWLMNQCRPVREQLTADQVPFCVMWSQLRTAVLGATRLKHDDDIVICADDWSDYAWLDITARSVFASVRDLGYAADSCAIVELAQLKHPTAKWPEFQGTPHVAVDDAAHGARMFCRAVELLR